MYDNNIILYELEHLKDKIDKLEVIHLNNELLLVIKLKEKTLSVVIVAAVF